MAGEGEEESVGVAEGVVVVVVVGDGEVERLELKCVRWGGFVLGERMGYVR